MNRYYSRKFIAALLSLAAASWSLAEKLVTSGDYKTIVLGTVGVYIAGNVAQKVMAKDGTEK